MSKQSARDRLAEAGTERVILIPSGDWQRDYEHAAELLAALT